MQTGVTVAESLINSVITEEPGALEALHDLLHEEQQAFVCDNTGGSLWIYYHKARYGAVFWNYNGGIDVAALWFNEENQITELQAAQYLRDHGFIN